jgi:DNA-binding transcriptional regulator/RsmH inhibitor MraZ
MYAVEFKTKIKDGIIIIPEKYRKGLKENVKVIVLTEEKENEASDIIEKLLDFPLKISDFKPMNREEIYDRI